MDDWAERDDLRGLLDARRRVVAAFEGIAAGAEALAARAAAAPDPLELDRLRGEVEEERLANAQLAERVRVLRERGGASGGEDAERLRAEAAALQAERAAERAEIDAVLRELIPIVEGAR